MVFNDKFLERVATTPFWGTVTFAQEMSVHDGQFIKFSGVNLCFNHHCVNNTSKAQMQIICRYMILVF